MTAMDSERLPYFSHFPRSSVIVPAMTTPSTQSPEEPRDEAAFRAAVEAGVASADAGRVVSYAKVREWLLSWGKPGELPAP